MSLPHMSRRSNMQAVFLCDTYSCILKYHIGRSNIMLQDHISLHLQRNPLQVPPHQQYCNKIFPWSTLTPAE